MASFQERVTIFIETKVDNAKSQLGGFKQSIADAEGATGKFKAAASGLGGIVSSAASSLLSPAGLAAGAAAVGTAAIKAVKGFEELGLTIGKVSAATGLSAEEASRWVEVADDAGVSSDAFTKSVGFMEKALGKNADAFDAWGVQVAKNADGTVNLNQTLLNAMDAVNAISDPLKKQAAGAAIFGKSWKDMAELIARGSGTLKENLAAVQDSKVFSSKDISTARDVRDGFDAVSDAVQGLSLTMGRELAPAVAKIAVKLGDLITKAGPAFKTLGDGLAESVDEVGPLIEGLGELVDLMGQLHGVKFDLGIPNAKDFTPFAGALTQAGEAIDAVSKSWKNMHDAQLEGSVNTEQLSRKQTDLAGTTTDVGDATDDAADALDLYNRQQKAANDVTEAFTHLEDSYIKSIQGQVDALKDLADTLDKQSDAAVSAADDQIAFNDAMDDFTKKAKDHKSSTNDIRDSAIGASKAHQALYESMTESAGATATATGKLDAQNATLLQTAATARGPAKAAIEDYLLSVNKIPEDKKTEIKAAINAGDLDTATRLLNDASVTRNVAYRSDVDNASAAKTQTELDQLAKDRHINFFPRLVGALGNVPGTTSSLSGGVGTTTAVATRAAPTSVTNVTNNVIVPRIPTGRELERVSQRWARVNGKS